MFSLYYATSLKSFFHRTWPAEVIACLDKVLDIQAQHVFDQLPGNVQAKWLALSHVSCTRKRALYLTLMCSALCESVSKCVCV